MDPQQPTQAGKAAYESVFDPAVQRLTDGVVSGEPAAVKQVRALMDEDPLLCQNCQRSIFHGSGTWLHGNGEKRCDLVATPQTAPRSTDA